MGDVFSKQQQSAKKAAAPPAVTVTDIDRTVLDLKNTRDKLQRTCGRLEKEQEQLLQRAKAAKQKGFASTAMNLLKLKKHKQQQLSSCQDQLLNVHQMVETIHSQQQTNAVLDVLKSGKNTLKRMHEERPIDDVLELMDQVQEQNEAEAEYNDILMNHAPTSNLLSAEQEQQVESELQALMEELSPTTPDAVDLPVAPNTKLPEIKDSKAEEPAEPEKKQAVLA